MLIFSLTATPLPSPPLPRAVAGGGFTGAHVDRVYMSRGSPDLLTLWTPLGDLPIEMGVLAVSEGSHRLPGFETFQATYGNMDAEKVGLKGTGWFTEDPSEITRKFGGSWKTADFRAGDALIFNLRTVHMSTTNTTRFARVSCDTRWQPASHDMDARFGKNGRQESGARLGLLSKMDDQESSVAPSQAQGTVGDIALTTIEGTVGDIAITLTTIEGTVGDIALTLTTIEGTVGDIALTLTTIEGTVGDIALTLTTIEGTVGDIALTLTTIEGTVGDIALTLTTIEGTVGDIALTLTTIEALREQWGI
ncbi:hypothetical protein EGW08_020507 [Elysia chlorotica]|uniref:Phytanoyl-CoA dioxygenase n=1 Tax=Elysia chlorotica TaxID=188477 RepID=A0A433SR58_ELYCH|nr:hypothetical protein EGW08_020507 [Elysia chlorotica]